MKVLQLLRCLFTKPGEWNLKKKKYTSLLSKMFVAVPSCLWWLKSLVGLCSTQPDVLHTPPRPSGGHLSPLLGWPEQEQPLQCPLPCLHGLPVPSVMVEVPVFARGPVAMLCLAKMSSRTTQKQLHPMVSAGCPPLKISNNFLKLFVF